MKNKDGLTSLEIVLVIFLLGIVVSYIFPLVNTNINLDRNNILLNKRNHIYSNIIEGIKVVNKNRENIDLYSIDFLEVISRFNTSGYYEEVIQFSHKDVEYLLKLEKENKSNEFWKVKIQINSTLEEKNEDEGVEFLLER